MEWWQFLALDEIKIKFFFSFSKFIFLLLLLLFAPIINFHNFESFSLSPSKYLKICEFYLLQNIHIFQEYYFYHLILNIYC